MFVSLLTEILTISGVALDLVGAAVLSHAHNARSIAEIGVEESALGEEDAIATQAQLLAEKRIGFLILTTGISVHLVGPRPEEPGGTVADGRPRPRRGGGGPDLHRALDQVRRTQGEGAGPASEEGGQQR